MKKANDILKDLGFKTQSATSTQEAFVSRLIKVARDGSQSSAQEIHIREFEAAIPSRQSKPAAPSSATAQTLTLAASPVASLVTSLSATLASPVASGLAAPDLRPSPSVRKATRAKKSAVSENQLAFQFDITDARKP